MLDWFCFSVLGAQERFQRVRKAYALLSDEGGTCQVASKQIVRNQTCFQSDIHAKCFVLHMSAGSRELLKEAIEQEATSFEELCHGDRI